MWDILGPSLSLQLIHVLYVISPRRYPNMEEDHGARSLTSCRI